MTTIKRPFRKTFWMNVAGAACWGLAAALIIFDQRHAALSQMLFIGGIYAAIAALPAFTAMALTPGAGSTLIKVMLGCNVAFLAIFLVGLIFAITNPFDRLFPIAAFLMGGAIVLTPAAINVWALRRHAKNSHSRPSAETRVNGAEPELQHP